MPSAKGTQRKEQLTLLVVRGDFSEEVAFELARDQDVGILQGETVQEGHSRQICAKMWGQGGTWAPQELDGKG